MIMLPPNEGLIKINKEAKTILILVKMPTPETQKRLKEELEKNYPEYTVIQRNDD